MYPTIFPIFYLRDGSVGIRCSAQDSRFASEVCDYI